MPCPRLRRVNTPLVLSLGSRTVIISAVLVSIGGINDYVGQIVELCDQLAVPVVFAMTRRRLAVLLKKKHRIGCVGIFYYDGAEVLYYVDTHRIGHVTWFSPMHRCTTNG